MASGVNHFARLGINAGASENEIKRAYRALAKKWHPDKNKDTRATETFQEIAASYEFLSSKVRREMHERELRKAAPETSQPTTHSSMNTPQPTTHSSMNTPKQTRTSASSQEKPKKPSTSSWSQSFTKRYSDQHRKQSNYHQRRTFVFTNTTADFSFLFGDKEDKMPFASMTEHFTEDKVGKRTSYKKQQHRHVAPEIGDISGLDCGYLFSPRQQPDEDRLEDKLSCPWCGAPLPAGKLFQHEEKCGKFGLSADEDEDSDSDGGCLTQLRQPGCCSMPVWQTQHQQLIRQIQRDKENYRSKLDRLDD